MSTEIATQADTTTIANGISTINPTTPAEAARLYAAVSSAKPLKDAVNVPLDVVDFLVQNGTAVADGGVVEDRLIVTLITADGQAYGSNSPTVASDLQNLVTIMGKPRTGFWGKSLKIVPKLAPSGQGRSYHTLTLADVAK